MSGASEVGADVGYDAFLSYGRSDGDAMVTAVDRLLGSIGRPWNTRRRIRTFRDRNQMVAGPEERRLISRGTGDFTLGRVDAGRPRAW